MSLTITTALAGKLVNHLHAAADQYSTDAQEFDEVKQPRLAEQFRRQSKDATEIADWIEANDRDEE